jgi:hypothetical protein
MVYGGYAHDRARPSRSRVRGTRPLTFWLSLVGLPLVIALGGIQMASLMTSPAEVIRSDLIRAGSEMQHLPWNTSRENVQRAIAGAFGRSVTVDAAGFPAYARITLDRVAQDTCIEALSRARRMEGQVVIVLQGYLDPADCSDANDMTWRIMP